MQPITSSQSHLYIPVLFVFLIHVIKDYKNNLLDRSLVQIDWYKLGLKDGHISENSGCAGKATCSSSIIVTTLANKFLDVCYDDVQRTNHSGLFTEYKHMHTHADDEDEEVIFSDYYCMS
jgi:hypothetical protein